MKNMYKRIMGFLVMLSMLFMFGYQDFSLIFQAPTKTDSPLHLYSNCPSAKAAYLEETPVSGKCGGNIVWDYDPDTYTLSINGSGKMYDYTFDKQPPWAEYRTEIEKLF